MLEYQKRLLDEARIESKKLNDLNKFMAGNIFPTLIREKKDLMYEQSRCMSKFVQILGKRLELEGLVFTHKIEENK